MRMTVCVPACVCACCARTSGCCRVWSVLCCVVCGGACVCVCVRARARTRTLAYVRVSDMAKGVKGKQGARWQRTIVCKAQDPSEPQPAFGCGCCTDGGGGKEVAAATPFEARGTMLSTDDDAEWLTGCDMRLPSDQEQARGGG